MDNPSSVPQLINALHRMVAAGRFDYVDRRLAHRVIEELAVALEGAEQYNHTLTPCQILCGQLLLEAYETKDSTQVAKLVTL